MNLIRVGLVVRALRRRLGWRQLDLALKAGVSQQAISRLERGQATRMSLETIDRILAALGADLELVVRWRGGELDRVLDARHAALDDVAATLISGLDWQVVPEVSYSEYGERGSIDLLGLRPAARLLLIVEVKSDLTVIEATIRKHDEKVRLAPTIARTRFAIDGPVKVLRLLILPDTGAARRRVAEHAAVLDRVYPVRGRNVRAWLRSPSPAQSGAILFLSLTHPVGGRRREPGPHRVRRAAARSSPSRRRVDSASYLAAASPPFAYHSRRE
ncbi:MAG: helix-turn-helix transcriptional regulator [Chloroflexota bacterium]